MSRINAFFSVSLARQITKSITAKLADEAYLCPGAGCCYCLVRAFAAGAKAEA
jgi:hypothetical protein